MEYPVPCKEPVAEQYFTVWIEFTKKVVADNCLPDIAVFFPISDDFSA